MYNVLPGLSLCDVVLVGWLLLIFYSHITKGDNIIRLPVQHVLAIIVLVLHEHQYSRHVTFTFIF